MPGEREWTLVMEISGPSIETPVSLIRSVVITNENEGSKLQIGEGEKEGEALVSCIFSYSYFS